MSTDEAVTKDLIETLEDGREGFAKGAEKLDATDSPELANTFRQLSEQRARFSGELREMAKDYGDNITESGSVVATLHRGWMSLKDALSGSDASGVLDAAKQGEAHAVKEFEKALADANISQGLRTLVERQFGDVQSAQKQVEALRSQQS